MKKDFTVIPNSLINDNSLSDRARFLFCYMASKPDNWLFYQEPLAKDLGYSLDTLRKYLKELISAGWVSRDERREDGKFDSFDYTLHPSPSRKNTDTVKNRVGEKPSRENSALYKKDYLEKKRDTKKESENAPAQTDFFSPNKHHETAAYLIAYLEQNSQYLNGMAKGDWKRAVKGYCLKLQKTEQFYALQVPEDDGAHYRWIAKSLAGIESWFNAAKDIDAKKGGNTEPAPAIRIIQPKQPQQKIIRASADAARKAAGL